MTEKQWWETDEYWHEVGYEAPNGDWAVREAPDLEAIVAEAERRGREKALEEMRKALEREAQNEYAKQKTEAVDRYAALLQQVIKDIRLIS